MILYFWDKKKIVLCIFCHLNFRKAGIRDSTLLKYSLLLILNRIMKYTNIQIGLKNFNLKYFFPSLPPLLSKEFVYGVIIMHYEFLILIVRQFE